MKCQACEATTHKLIRLQDGRWLCPACKFELNPAYLTIKTMTLQPPSPQTVKLVGFLIGVQQRPDYSRN